MVRMVRMVGLRNSERLEGNVPYTCITDEDDFEKIVWWKEGAGEREDCQ